MAVAESVACLALFVDKDSENDVFSQTPDVERPQLLIPWVKGKNSVVKPKSVPLQHFEVLKNHILELIELNRHIVKGELVLTSKQVQQQAEFYTRIISQYLSHLRITHEILEFKAINGNKIFKIRILTSRESASPSALGHLADRIDSMQADLVFNVNYFLTQKGDSAVVPAVDLIRQNLSIYAAIKYEVYFPIPKNRSLLLLPIYALLNPDYAAFSPSVNHEILHLEKLHRLRLGKPFAFYGRVEFQESFSFLDLIYADPPVIQAMNGAYRDLAFDESAAFAVTLLELKQSLRHQDSEYNKPFAKEDPLLSDLSNVAAVTKVHNQVAQIVASEVMKMINHQSDRIQFILKNNTVYAKFRIAIQNKGKIIQAKVEIPLVEARGTHTKTQKLDHLSRQMQSMIFEAQRNSILANWAGNVARAISMNGEDPQVQHEMAVLLAQSLYLDLNPSVSHENFEQNLKNKYLDLQQRRQN